MLVNTRLGVIDHCRALAQYRTDKMAKQLDPAGISSIGVISDTHGHIPQGLAKAFKHVDLIIHAGDIGDKTILNKLAGIAPVIAVRGNMDYGNWAGQLPQSETIKIGPHVIYVQHIASRLKISPGKAGHLVLINGHTHRPDVYAKNGVTFINPGSAAFPKFGQPATAALIEIKGNRLNVKLIRLKD